MGTRTPVPVREYMSESVETVTADTPLADAAQTMREQRINSLIVEGDEHAILTSTDVVGVVADRREITELTAVAAATAVITTVEPDLPLTQAASMMLRHESSHLPVVDGGEIVGILSQTDIARSTTE